MKMPSPFLAKDHYKQARSIYRSMLKEWRYPYFMRDNGKLAIKYKNNFPYYAGEPIPVAVAEALSERHGLPTKMLICEDSRSSTMYIIPKEVNYLNIDPKKANLAYYDNVIKERKEKHRGQNKPRTA